MKYFYILFLVSLIGGYAVAQTVPQSMNKTILDDSDVTVKPSTQQHLTKSNHVLWGAGSTTGAIDGEFGNAFVQAGTFAAGDNPASWTALSISQSGGSVSPGSAYWTRSTLGYSQGAYWGGTTPASSNSAANGVAIFDSDFMDNAGNPGAFGTGTSPSPHKGELISPRIDLTGQTDQALTVSFFTWYRDFAINELSVSLSVDDGATWTTSDYRSLTSNLTEEEVSVTFSGVTTGISNLTQCRIKFTFDGDYYFAIVDDISISQALTYDLDIATLGDGTGPLIERGEQIQLTGNRYFPISQLAMDARHLSFGANVVNRGALDILTTDGPALTLDIEYNDPSTGWGPVYSETINATQDIPSGSGITFSQTPIADVSWLMVGDFRATYTASFNGTDGDLTNNSIQHLFTITPDDYVSKVGLDAQGDPLADRSIFPGGGPFSQWEYGSVFYFDNASATNLAIDEISFVYRLSNGFAGAANQTMYVNIYSLSDNDGDGTLTDRTELTQIGSGSVALTGLGTTVPNGTYAVAHVTNIVDLNNLPIGPLTDGHYYISIVTNPSLAGGSATFDVNDVPWIGASENINYSMNLALTTANQVINPSPLFLTDQFGMEINNFVGFGADVIPSIGISLSGVGSTTSSNGSFTNSATWRNGILPAFSSTVTIDHDVTIDTDVTVDGSLIINPSKSLTVTPGNVLTLNGNIINNGSLIFKNDASGVGQILNGSTATVSGDVTVERYIPALSNFRRAYRFVTSAVNSTGSIFQNWQENGNTPAGYGTHISGSSTGANGFDITGSGDPSMFTYDHLNNAWFSIPNTDTDALIAGKPYRLFVRGDRNYDMTSNPVDPVNSNVTLRASGTLNLDDVVFEGTQSGGVDIGEISRNAGEFSFLGNPYQAVVDFESLAKVNVNPNFLYIWNANLNLHGAYETIDVSGAIDFRQYIQPGQAFFVVTQNNGDASMTFTDADKVTDFSTNRVFSDEALPTLELKLMSNSSENIHLLDQVRIVFDGDNELNNMDAPKLRNDLENLSRKTIDGLYSIEHREIPKHGEQLPLDISGLTSNDYLFAIKMQNLPTDVHAFLIDRLDNSTYLINDGMNFIELEFNQDDAKSMDSDRFLVAFETEELTIKPTRPSTIYPNPLYDGKLNISIPELANNTVDVTITNLLGQNVFSINTFIGQDGLSSLELGDIARGAYIVQFTSGNYNVSQKLIVK